LSLELGPFLTKYLGRQGMAGQWEGRMDLHSAFIFLLASSYEIEIDQGQYFFSQARGD
jgi:hypothetical protein